VLVGTGEQKQLSFTRVAAKRPEAEISLPAHGPDGDPLHCPVLDASPLAAEQGSEPLSFVESIRATDERTVGCRRSGEMGENGKRTERVVASDSGERRKD